MTKKLFKEKTKFTPSKNRDINPENQKIFAGQKKKNSKKNSRKDLTRFVKWPKFMRIQRQKQILFKRLKIPPVINLFIRLPDKNETTKVMNTFFPGGEKSERWSTLSNLKWIDESKNRHDKKGTENVTENKKNSEENFSNSKNYMLTGLRRVINSIRNGKALFVIISYDVNPIEMIVWLPFLCKKYNVAFSIINNKKVLGKKFGLKQTSCAVILKHHKNPSTDDKEKIFRYYSENL